ncbi:MAG: hypothetical protein GY929_26555 [Actinomycetia bacterium]|nr:hypothetical protein [Actinomycetes bacterium]
MADRAGRDQEAVAEANTSFYAALEAHDGPHQLQFILTDHHVDVVGVGGGEPAP